VTVDDMDIFHVKRMYYSELHIYRYTIKDYVIDVVVI
jgi:hypothetical protein